MCKTPRQYRALLLFAIIAAVSSLASAANASTQSQVFQTWYSAALLANAAYQGETELAKSVSMPGYILDTSGTLPGYGVSYFVLTNAAQKKHIIVVRGTSNIENVMVDAAFKLLQDDHIGIKLHQGFAVSANYLYDRIKPKLNRDYVIDTTGHSLGGAVALILAMHLDADKLHVGKIITFGQPKVTNIAGSKRYAHLDVTRIVMEKDPVPLSPPFDPMELMNLDIYWHLGKEIVLLKNNSYAELEGLDSMMRAVDFFQALPGTEHVQHHYMSSYLAALQLRTKNAVKVSYKSSFSLGNIF